MSQHTQPSLIHRPVAAVLAACVAVVLALGLTMSPAGATGRHHGDRHGQAGAYVQPPTPYHNVGSFDPECADVDVSGTYDYEGVDSIRKARHTGGQAFFYKDTFRFTEVWSEAGSGEVLFTLRGAYRFEEVRAERVRKSAVPDDAVPPEGLTGPIYLFTSVEKGHDTLRDATGHALYRTRGVVVYESLFDTLGDGEPGGNELTFEPVRVSGPHPLMDVDLCDVAAQLAG
jgi:hypothetical protein